MAKPNTPAPAKTAEAKPRKVTTLEERLAAAEARAQALKDQLAGKGAKRIAAIDEKLGKLEPKAEKLFAEVTALKEERAQLVSDKVAGSPESEG